VRRSSARSCLPLHAGADRNLASWTMTAGYGRLPLHAGADRNGPMPSKKPPLGVSRFTRVRIETCRLCRMTSPLRSPASRGCGSKLGKRVAKGYPRKVSRFTRVRIETRHCQHSRQAASCLPLHAGADRNVPAFVRRSDEERVSRFTRVRIETRILLIFVVAPGGLPLHAGADRNVTRRAIEEMKERVSRFTRVRIET